MYYMLECYSPVMEDATDIGDVPEIPGVDSWMTGNLITAKVDEPIRIELDQDNPGVMLEMFKSDILLMTTRLVNALKEAGVSNLQTYRAVLVDPVSGKKWDDYLMVNVVGLVACVDLEKSNWDRSKSPDLIGMNFSGLTIDPTRAGNLLMFRLAECVSALIVHQKVKNYLLGKGFDMLTFALPEEWIG